MFAMKTLTAAAITCLLMSSLTAQEIISAGDGKQYQLNADGTWRLVSDDRYLDTADGRRVRLTPDGKWQYVGLAPEVSEEKVQTLMLAATVDAITIYETRETVGGGKNMRIKSQTVVALKLALADEAEAALNLATLDTADFALTDNRGKRYPVVDLQAPVASLTPGSSTTLTITSDKAPKRLRKTAEFVLSVAPQTLGNTDSIELRFDYDRVKRQTAVK